MHPAALYVVATPIGNLEDITYRAVRLLAEADLVVAEDTRRSRILLEHYDIRQPMISLHEHNEQERIPELLNRLSSGESMALISDAGTPLISDPGYRLVREAASAGVPVIPVPGPSSVTAALCVAGLPTDRFAFEGFLPARPGNRRKQLGGLAGEPRTLVFFESSHRIEACLADMRETFTGARQAVICRELTKQFETVLRGSLDELIARLEQSARQRKGEFVIVIEGAREPGESLDSMDLARQLLEYLPASQAARVAARVVGGNRRDIYERLQPRES
jgi:16S rRNA (cytidine1402-2'-O)-methyltransferase